MQQLARHCERNQIRCLIAGNMTVDVTEFQEFDCVTVQNDVISPERKWRLYRAAKVVLNVFRDSETPADSPNPRIVEVTALGGPALLTGPNRSEVTRLFGDAIYHFTDFASLVDGLELALSDGADRAGRVAQAKAITLNGHLQEHRARELLRICREDSVGQSEITFPAEDRLGWSFGCGRAGSTWLGQMLGQVDGICSWHEPMFGKHFGLIQGKPGSPVPIFTSR
jgi:hypothetical protein